MIGHGPQHFLIAIAVLHGGVVVRLLQVLLNAQHRLGNGGPVMLNGGLGAPIRVVEHFPEKFFAHQVHVVRESITDGSNTEPRVIVNYNAQRLGRTVNNFPARIPTQTR